MFYRVLTDIVLILHLIFIVFAVGGGLLTLCWRWIPWVHLPALAWGAAVELFGWYCPLTSLENYFRRASGNFEYTESYVERYLVPVIYPVDYSREYQLVLFWLLIAFNVLVYASLYLRRRHS